MKMSSRIRREHVDVFFAFRVPYPNRIHYKSASKILGTKSMADANSEPTLLLSLCQKQPEEDDNCVPIFMRAGLVNETGVAHL